MELARDTNRKGTRTLKSQHAAVGSLICAAVVFSFTAAASSDLQSQQAPATLPTVVAAAMPVYAGIAKQAGVAGSVTFQVQTDGDKVQLTTAKQTAPLLDAIAQENLKTWRFAPHQPTSFEVTFRFKSIDKRIADPCGPNRKAPWTGPEPVSTIQLPTLVEIEALRDLVVICDPTVTLFEKPVSRIRGTVVCDCEGRRPIADAEVTVEEEMRVLQRTRTDANGKFSLPSVGWGTKSFTVHKHGYFTRYYQAKSRPLPWIRPGDLNLEIAPDAAQLQPEPRTKTVLVPATVPLYPAAAREKNIEGEVRLALAADGQLSPVSGPAELLGPTMETAQTWKVVKGDDPAEIRINYKLIDGDCTGSGPVVKITGVYNFQITAKRIVPCGPVK